MLAQYVIHLIGFMRKSFLSPTWILTDNEIFAIGSAKKEVFNFKTNHEANKQSEAENTPLL